MMSESYKELPDDCWELIFSHLPHHTHFASLSLVSKQFRIKIERLRSEQGVNVLDCESITEQGVLFMLRNSINLNSISTSGIKIERLRSEDMSFTGRRLSSLDLRDSSISNEFFRMLVEACVDLRRLSLDICSGFTISSLALFLGKCRTLQHLALARFDCVRKVNIDQVLPYLPNLVTLELGGLHISLYTFHTVAKRCPSLEFVQMLYSKCTFRYLHLDYANYACIKSLNLSRSCLDNKFLIEVALVCPNLETLDISHCNITEKSLAEFLDTCHEIRRLSIAGCQTISSIGKGSVLPKVEVLDAAFSNINDEGLAQIAMRCPDLRSWG